MSVCLATSNSKHTTLVVKALRAGIHVLCEKPAAGSRAHCQEMVAASEESGAKLMVGHHLHFEEATVETLETVRAGKIGKPHLFTSMVTQQIAAEKLHKAVKNHAGLLPEIGVRLINAVRQIFQAMPAEVFAFSANKSEPCFKGIERMPDALLVTLPIV